jgi:hypothetical protein
VDWLISCLAVLPESVQGSERHHMESGRGYEQKESDGSLKYSKPNDHFLQKKLSFFLYIRAWQIGQVLEPCYQKRKKRRKQKSEDEESEVWGARKFWFTTMTLVLQNIHHLKVSFKLAKPSFLYTHDLRDHQLGSNLLEVITMIEQ